MLGDLFNKYGSDKDRNGYSPYYDAIFKNLKQKPISMLEIGIGTMIPGGFFLHGGLCPPRVRPWRKPAGLA